MVLVIGKLLNNSTYKKKHFKRISLLNYCPLHLYFERINISRSLHFEVQIPLLSFGDKKGKRENVS